CRRQKTKQGTWCLVEIWRRGLAVQTQRRKRHAQRISIEQISSASHAPRTMPATMNLHANDDANAPPTTELPLPSWRLVTALALPVLGQQGLSFLVLLSDRW